ncbi:MAG: (Fe-S)-binding protein [Deltaproteobacteria bacterium]|nr:(Fe-S)-binding protein [Deltaproteobacteria bacterium]
MSLSSLSTLYSLLSNCVLCGTCRSVCPTFDVVKMEQASPRGKTALCKALLNNEIGLSERFIKHINECVLCGACRESCPNDVPVPEIVITARGEAFKNGKIDFTRTAISKFFGSEKAGNTFVKFASKIQNLFFKRVPEESGLHRRFPLPFIGKNRLMPQLAKEFFLEVRSQKSEVRSKKDKSQHCIGFFAGCLINYIYPHIGEASLSVLERIGASVIVPLDQACCGMPAVGAGDIETAKKLAIKNLLAFERYELDYITTACATCGEGLKRRFKELLADEGDGMQQRVERFAHKVKDITELLANEVGVKYFTSHLPPPTSQIVTYHDPCHLSRGQGIKDEPRELIEFSGYRFKEMSHPCKCCGLGGSFNITNYEFSMEINRKKAMDIKNTGAQIAATSCPGCIMQIKDGLHKIGAKTKVVHVVELLA